MDNALWGLLVIAIETVGAVLILVLMDNALWELSPDCYR